MGTISTEAKEKAETLAEQLKSVVDAGQVKLDAAKERILDGKDMVADRAKSAMDTVTGAIKEHPLKAIAIAFGVGYVGMRILR